ncbi:ribonuclease P protein component [candidate division WS5 bacterium]|uniref:Ribonuclease P protein component n=1 Tax=candidate division WS5 bacterium TaxID=2093353 RepID=A0A419DGR6_9BACT|nr:MAG: ribonuclease P protein component [candidate division WS5 bacterium]
MLSREKRLTKGRDFDRVYQKGKRLSSESFNLNLSANRSAVTRVGIVVGKKFSKKAVERNRAKRVFREAVKEVYTDIKPGFDMVIFVKGAYSKNLKMETARKEIVELMKKAGVLK